MWSVGPPLPARLSNGLTIDSGPDPGLRGYETGLVLTPSLASAQPAAEAVGGSGEREQERRALKPPWAMSLPRQSGVSHMARST